MKLSKLKVRISTFAVMLIIIFAGFSAFAIMSHPKPMQADGCQPQNVIECGVTDRTDLVNQINNGDGIHTDIKSIFAAIGISPEDVASADTVPGSVTQDGRVLVNGSAVATNVIMGERQTAGVGGTPFAGLVWNPISIRFAPGISQGAYVHMVNGHFTWAIITSCGNPVLTSFASQNSLTITKEVRNVTQNPNSTTYANSVNANVGDIVRFRVHATNNGSETDQNVTLKDTLPNNLTLESGTAQVTFQQLVNNTWQIVTQTIPDADVAGGHNVGSLQPTQDAFLIFNAKVTSGPESGCAGLVDTAFASSTQTGAVQATATVNVCSAVTTTTTTVPPTTTTTVPSTTTTTVPPITTTTMPIAPPTNSPQVASVTPAVSTAVSPSRLPVSGPVEATGGAMGTMGIGYAGYLWRKSRKRLNDILRKK